MTRPVDQLTRNDWERKDMVRVRARMPLVAAGVSLLFWALLFIIDLPRFFLGWTEALVVNAAVATAVMVLAWAIILWMWRGWWQFVPTTGVWYFAALVDARLDRDRVHAMLREILVRHGYAWAERSHQATRYLWFAMFDLVADFKVRTQFMALPEGKPIAEVGLGPETAANGGSLSVLREEISRAFARANPPPASVPLPDPGPPM
jgi:hypothetical protein